MKNTLNTSYFKKQLYLSVLHFALTRSTTFEFYTTTYLFFWKNSNPTMRNMVVSLKCL